MTTTSGSELLCKHEWDYMEANYPKDKNNLKTVAMYLITPEVVYSGKEGSYLVDDDNWLWKRYEDSEIHYKYGSEK